MSEYHKIQTVYLRDPATKHKTLLEGQFSLPEFEYLRDVPWTWTEKIDGTNVRVVLLGSQVFFHGKTDEAQLPATLFEHLRATFSGEQLRAVFPDEREPDPLIGPDPLPVVLYGEGYGAKIQKGGGNYRPDPGFILFDVRVGRWWLKLEDVQEIARKLYIPHVPMIGVGTLREAVEHTRKGFPSVVAEGRCIAEGLVMRPLVELFGRNGGRIIAKIKARDFVTARGEGRG